MKSGAGIMLVFLALLAGVAAGVALAPGRGPTSPSGGGLECGVLWTAEATRSLELGPGLTYIVVEVDIGNRTVSVGKSTGGGVPPPDRTVLPTDAKLANIELHVYVDGREVWRGTLDPTIPGAAVLVDGYDGVYAVHVVAKAWGCWT